MEKYLAYINLASLSSLSGFSLKPEYLFGLLGLIFLLLFGLSLGKTKSIISLLSIYIAYVLQAMFPYFQELHGYIKFSPEMYFTRIALFLVFYIAVFAIVNKSLLKHRLSMREYSFVWVSLISLLQLGLLVSVIVNFIPSDKLGLLPESVLPYFNGQIALFVWLLIPVVILIFMKRGKRERVM